MESKLEKLNVEFTRDFIDFIKKKNHPNIVVCKEENTLSLPYKRTIRIPLFYYNNRINKVEQFWEKKIFNFLVNGINEISVRYEIINITLSSTLVDFGEENTPYNLKRGFMLH